MKKIGLLSITEWSRARRLSVCINNKSQRRHSLHGKEVAAHSSSVDDGSNADRISLHAVGQAQLSFLSLPHPPSLKPSALGTESWRHWAGIAPFWIRTSLQRQLCHQNLLVALAEEACFCWWWWWSVLPHTLRLMNLNKGTTVCYCMSKMTNRYRHIAVNIHSCFMPTSLCIQDCSVLLQLVIASRWKPKIINGWS